MSSPILTASSTVQCAHLGVATPTTTSPRVKIMGSPVVTLSAVYSVAGCTLVPPPIPPCTTGVWLVGAARVRVGGVFVVTASGTGNSLPPGTPLAALQVQPRVKAT